MLERIYTKNKWIELAKNIHNNRYEYSDIIYYKNKLLVKNIICNIHGKFNQIGNNHLNGKGCPECGKEKAIKISRNRTINTEKFIEKSNKIHNNKYDYSKTIYINTRHKIIVTCPKHGDFLQRASAHLNSKHGCPICKESQGEKKISNLLISHNINFKRQKVFEDLKYKKSLFFDFYLIDFNMCIEYDGLQHFEHVMYFGKDEKFFHELQIRDKLKNVYCLKNNIPLLRLSYKDNDEQIKYKILNFLNIRENKIIKKFNFFK